MGGQRVERPTPGELEWVRSNVDVARSLVAAYTGSAGSVADPAILDETFAAWLSAWLDQPERDRDDPNPYINAVGLAFGQALVDQLDLEWAVVSDEHGTEMAVHGQPGDILVFPPNLVAKRFETGETGFLVPIYEEVARRVRELRSG